jgi:hypothetical protein
MKKLARVRSSSAAILKAFVRGWSAASALPAEARFWFWPYV